MDSNFAEDNIFVENVKFFDYSLFSNILSTLIQDLIYINIDPKDILLNENLSPYIQAVFTHDGIELITVWTKSRAERRSEFFTEICPIKCQNDIIILLKQTSLVLEKPDLMYLVNENMEGRGLKRKLKDLK